MGKHIFDNSDCSEKPFVLSRDVQEKVDQILSLERDSNCVMDNSSKRHLDVTYIKSRMQLLTQPLNDGLDSACRYDGDDALLHSDLSENSSTLGYIITNDILLIEHDGKVVNESPDWFFINDVIRENKSTGIQGWGHKSIIDRCDTIAG
jgi:hypothetical protein